jgi:hypothetical protein
MTDWISPKQFHESEGVEAWRVIGDGACTYFRTESLAASARPVTELPICGAATAQWAVQERFVLALSSAAAAWWSRATSRSSWLRFLSPRARSRPA